jgi:uncharacterized protein with HEPN domain
MSDEIRKADLRAPDYLDHMIQACDRITAYTAGMTQERFLSDTLVQDAVLRNIEILGEATNQLLERSPHFETDYQEIPWTDIYGMRNRIAHAYFFINFEIVWSVSQKRIPELRSLITQVLRAISPEP